MGAPRVTDVPDDAARSAEDLLAMREGCPCARCEALRKTAEATNGSPRPLRTVARQQAPPAPDLDALADAAGRVDGRVDRMEMDPVERLTERLEALVHEVEVIMRRVRALEWERYGDELKASVESRSSDRTPQGG